MQGRRVKDKEIHELLPGEYLKRFEDDNATWFICTPNGERGAINPKIWNIIEHENADITVSPSIRISVKDGKGNEIEKWHGYLENGIWREC